MEQRFTTQSSRYGQSFSESTDKYGFHTAHSSQTTTLSSDYAFQKKPQFKITVSSTGKIEEKPLPSITEQPSLLPSKENFAITLKSLEKAFASPWLQKYQGLGKSLLSALRDEPYVKSKDVLPESPKRYLRYQPYFANCSPDSRNHATFNRHNLYLSLFITQENLEKRTMDIFPFGMNSYKINLRPVTFEIYDSEDVDLLGRAYGDIILNQGIVIIRLTRLENFAREELNWQDIPVGSHFITSLTVEESISYDNVLEDDTLKVEELPQPYFEDLTSSSPPSPSEKNYCHLKGETIQTYVEINIIPPPHLLVIPIKNLEKTIHGKILDSEEKVLAYAELKLSNNGYITIESLNRIDDPRQSITWKELDAKEPLYLVFETDIDDN